MKVKNYLKKIEIKEGIFDFVWNKKYMKNNSRKNNNPFSFRLNDNEFEILRELKDEYAINISGAFKMFLKRYLKVLKENDKDI